MQWYRKDPERWLMEQNLAKKYLHDVSIGFEISGKAVIEGNLSLMSNHGHEYEQVRLRIIYPSKFPKHRTHPAVYLVSHKDCWVNEEDSHIEKDWKLCLYVPVESKLNFYINDSLIHLLACVHVFLIKERIYQRDFKIALITGVPARWPGKDRAHGVPGLIEAFNDTDKLSGNSPCLCGSGKRFKRCCRNRMRKLT